MKKFKCVLLFIVLMIFSVVKVNALSVDKNEITIKNGGKETINLSTNVEVEVSSVVFRLVYTSNDVPANFYVNGYTDNITGTVHEISLGTSTSGNISLGTIEVKVVDSPKDKIGSINIVEAKAITPEGDEVPLERQTITITVDNSDNTTSNDDIDNSINNNGNTVTNPDNNLEDNSSNTDNVTSDKKDESTLKEEGIKKDDKETEKVNLLKSIDSDLVNINLKNNVYDYVVKVKEDIKELDLKPVAIDDSYKVEVSSQKIEELVDGKITITISKEDVKEVYTINVKILEDIEVDNNEFSSSYSYKGKWITIIVILSVVLVIGLLFVRKRR